MERERWEGGAEEAEDAIRTEEKRIKTCIWTVVGIKKYKNPCLLSENFVYKNVEALNGNVADLDQRRRLQR